MTLNELERLIKNHGAAWHNYTFEEREDLAQELAKQILKITNPYQKSELYRRIYLCGDILYYIANYL